MMGHDRALRIEAERRPRGRVGELDVARAIDGTHADRKRADEPREISVARGGLGAEGGSRAAAVDPARAKTARPIAKPAASAAPATDHSSGVKL